jgi:dihydroneopterin triphosphate diphosphatase
MASVVSRIVEVCIFRFTGNAVEYLLLRRAKNDSLYPGIWQWVTGAVSEGENSLAAARRELREETGLTGVRLWVVPHISSFYDSLHDRVHLSPLFAVQVETDIDPVLSAEHDRLRWVSYEEARRGLVWPGQREGLDIVNNYILRGEEGANLVEIGEK